MLFFISGFGGAGKDTIANAVLESLGIKKLVTYTTREPRKGEVDGLDYYFVSEEDFVHKSYQNFWLECRKYDFVGKRDIVRYATPKYSDYETTYLSWGSVDQAIKIRQRNSDPNMYWIHIQVSPRERLNRMLNRATSDIMVIEACRRLYQDHLDFKEVEDEFCPDFVVENQDGELDKAISTVIQIIERM